MISAPTISLTQTWEADEKWCRLDELKVLPIFGLAKRPEGVRLYIDGALSKSLISQTMPMQELPTRRTIYSEVEWQKFTAR